MLATAGALGVLTWLLPPVPDDPDPAPVPVPVAGPDGEVDPAFAHHPLYSTAVGIDGTGKRHLLPADPPPAWVSGTRVFGDDPAARDRAGGQVSWLEAGHVPGTGAGQAAAGEFADMVRTALLDIHTLTTDDGGVVAGWSVKWRYHWPRDAAFAAVALARTGHVEDAVRVLERFQDLLPPGGRFQARYVPGTATTPDDRGVQIDGTGWLMWATARVLVVVPEGGGSSLDGRAGTPLDGWAGTAPGVLSRAEVLDRLGVLVEGLTSALVRLVDGGASLPPVSSDYWEVREMRRTLGTAAPVLAGLYAAAGVARMAGRTADAADLHRVALAAESRVHEHFGSAGYTRYRWFSERDAAVAFLLPPFQPTEVDTSVAPGNATARREVAEAFDLAAAEMARPAGGLAPGAGWKKDGISWTPQTALFAWTRAANGDTAGARDLLRWLRDHRTPDGALPEKVLADGSPAAVAPLAWTASLVVLAVAELESHEADAVVDGDF